MSWDDKPADLTPPPSDSTEPALPKTKMTTAEFEDYKASGGVSTAVIEVVEEKPPCYCGKPHSICLRDNGSGCRHPHAAAHMWGD